MNESKGEVKVVLLGKENGGKSCLVVRYLHKRYNPKNVQTVSNSYRTGSYVFSSQSCGTYECIYDQQLVIRLFLIMCQWYVFHSVISLFNINH